MTWPWDGGMPVRVLQYVASFLKSLIDQKRLPGGKVPPVLPIVLYNGDEPWSKADSLAGMRVSGIPEALMDYQPQLRFYLIDETRLPVEALDRDYLTSILFAIEQKGDFEQARVLMRKLARTLKSRYQDTHQLQRELTELLLVMFEKRFPGFAEQNDEIGDLDMLATRVEQWYQQALKKGIQQGLEQGLLRGEARMLERQLHRRFGPLPEWVQEKLHSATERELDDWADAVLEAESLEAVFGQKTT